MELLGLDISDSSVRPIKVERIMEELKWFDGTLD